MRESANEIAPPWLVRQHRRLPIVTTMERGEPPLSTPFWFQASCLIPRIVIHSCLLCFHCASLFSGHGIFIASSANRAEGRGGVRNVGPNNRANIHRVSPCGRTYAKRSRGRPFVSALDHACTQSRASLFFFSFFFFLLVFQLLFDWIMRRREGWRRTSDLGTREDCSKEFREWWYQRRMGRCLRHVT